MKPYEIEHRESSEPVDLAAYLKVALPIARRIEAEAERKESA